MITLKPNTVIHVKTQEEYDELQKEMGESGFNLLSMNQWPSYKEDTCINIEYKKYPFFSNMSFYKSQGYTIEEYRPEFRVGDTVEKQNADTDDIIANGIRGEVIKILLDTYLVVRWFNGREFYYDPKYLKLLSRAEEPKPVEKEWVDYDRFLSLYRPYGKSLHENFNKPNKKTFMTNIVEFAKNQALKATNPDEFALRAAGLKDQEGNWTADARQIVVNLKAEKLGYEDFQDMVKKNDNVLEVSVSPFEFHALFIEFAADLLKIAQEKLASEAKK